MGVGVCRGRRRVLLSRRTLATSRSAGDWREAGKEIASAHACARNRDEKQGRNPETCSRHRKGVGGWTGGRAGGRAGGRTERQEGKPVSRMLATRIGEGEAGREASCCT